jgi:hypothetical protein
MNFLLLIPYYFKWHYSRGFLAIFEIWKNLFWFLWNFFSIGVLLKSFFEPFERLSEKYGGGLDVERFINVLLLNLIMRLVGMFLRTFIIIVGLLICFLFLLFGIFGLIIWFILPLILIAFLITSLIILTS